MLLAIDVGNTNIVYGLFEGERPRPPVSRRERRGRTADEYAVVAPRSSSTMHGVAPDDVDAAIIASVVPSLTEPMVELVRSAFGHERARRRARASAPAWRSSTRTRARSAPIASSTPSPAFDKAKGRRHRRRLRHRDDVRLRHAEGRVPRRRHRARACRSAPTRSSRAPRSSRASRSPSRRRSSAATPSTRCSRASSTATSAWSTASSSASSRSSATRARSSPPAASRSLIAPLSRTITDVDDELTLVGLRILYERNRV